MAWRKKRQAIIWTNDDLVYWGVYVSFDLDMLINLVASSM